MSKNNNRLHQIIQSKKLNKYLVILNSILFILTLSVFIPAKWIGVEELEYKGAGQPYSISHYITLEDTKEQSNFYLTYVTYYKPKSISNYLLTKYKEKYSDFHLEALPKGSSSIPDYMTTKEYKNYSVAITENGFQTPIYLAYKYAGKELDVKEQGMLIQYVLPNDTYKEVGNDENYLHIGDIIQSMNGKSFTNKKEFVQDISNLKDGEKVELEVLRNNKMKTVYHRAIKDKEGNSLLGVLYEDYAVYDLPKEVTYDKASLSGSSAGLMFTLYLTDLLLKDNNLDKGYKIAGSGAVDKEGNVHQIGSADFKVQGAIQSGFDIFFIPKDINENDMNEKIVKEEVKKHNTNIQVVPVATVQEALDYLENLTPKK